MSSHLAVLTYIHTIISLIALALGIAVKIPPINVLAAIKFKGMVEEMGETQPAR